ncbi:helix-turn-helix domain-containing protein [Streptomyces mayteni]
MPVDSLDLLLHPVRLRIVHAMSGDRTRTTADLCATLRDIPKTTVYRHVGLLAAAGVLEVAGEQRVHGAVERSYRLRRARARIDRETAAGMSLDEHRRAFPAGMAVLLAEFNAYLDRGDADPFADSVAYTQFPLWLSEDELAEVVREITRVIVAHRDNAPTQDRSPHLLSPILFPTAEPPAAEDVDRR